MTHHWSADWYLLCWHQNKVFTPTLGQNQKRGLSEGFILNVPFDQAHNVMRWWSPPKTAAIDLRGQSSWYIWWAKRDKFFSIITWLKNITWNWSWVFPKNGIFGGSWKTQAFSLETEKEMVPCIITEQATLQFHPSRWQVIPPISTRSQTFNS